MRKITSLSISTLSKLALVVGANASIGAYAADQIETVIVTASKIKQESQQVAISMEALSSEKLSNAGINSVAEIAKFTPGLQLEQPSGGISAIVRIRGIGTPGLSPLDPSVPIFIDGVSQARTGSGFQDLLDIARVEVLRGPQGTLYGRNSTAGAINVWTKDANSHRWEGSLQTQLGNYNDREIKGTVNVPLVDNLLAARISAYSVKQDGYLTNAITHNTANGDADRFGARAKILLTPSSDLSVQWLTEYSNSITHAGQALVKVPALFTDYATNNGIVSQGGLRTFPHDDAYNGKIYGNIDQRELDTDFATSVTVNWDLDSGLLKGATFTSITAYDLYKTNQRSDQDASILDYGTGNGPGNTSSWSQEFHLSGDVGDFQYLTGFYYYADRVTANQEVNQAGSDALAISENFGGFPADVKTHDWFNTDTVALFGNATYNFSPQFSVTAGLRESWAQKRGNSALNGLAYFPGGSTLPIVTDIVDHATIVETNTSGVLKARYFVADNTMLYASYDRGFKPGGFNRVIFNTDGTIPTSFHKEVSTNYEVGAKTQWLDNRLQANIAAFYMEFKGYHYQFFDAVKDLIIENLPQVTTEGVELDVQALPFTGLTVGAGAAYINPRIKEINPAYTSFDNLHSGQLLSDASQYSANINAEYSHQLAGSSAQAFARFDTSYRSRYILGEYIDGNYQSGYTQTNIRFGVRNFDGHWQFTSWAKNIFNKEYAIYGGSNIAGQHDGLAIVQGAPRTYGVTVQYDY